MLHVLCWSDGWMRWGIAYYLNRTGTFVTSRAPGKLKKKTCPNSTVTWWLTAVKIKYLPFTFFFFLFFFVWKAVLRLKGFEGHLLPLCVFSCFKIQILWHYAKKSLLALTTPDSGICCSRGSAFNSSDSVGIISACGTHFCKRKC